MLNLSDKHGAMGYLLRVPLEVFVILFMGLVASRYLESKGVSVWLYRRFYPVMSFFNIPPAFCMIFFTSAVSGFAGEALIALSISEGRIRERDLIPGLMLVNFPLFLSFAPVVLAITVPLVGWVGVAYLWVQLAISSVITFTGAVLFMLGNRQPSTFSGFSLPERRDFLSILKEAFVVSVKISLVVGVSISVVRLLMNLGAVEAVRTLLSGLNIPCFESNFAPISIAHAFHLAAGAVVAHGLMQAGLAPLKVLLGMVWGYVLGVPLRGVFNILPRYCAMYGVGRGIRAWLVVQCYRALVGVLAVFLLCSLASGVR